MNTENRFQRIIITVLQSNRIKKPNLHQLIYDSITEDTHPIIYDSFEHRHGEPYSPQIHTAYDTLYTQNKIYEDGNLFVKLT